MNTARQYARNRSPQASWHLRGLRLIATFLGAMLIVMQLGAINVGAHDPITLTIVCKDDGSQCISDIKKAPHGTYADISFRTSIAAPAIIQVGKQPPKVAPSGDYTYDGITLEGFKVSNGTQHAARFDDLTPNTKYYYLINASSAGKDDQAVGSFTTLKRVVTIEYSQIQVIDDTEDFGDGKLAFNFYPGTDMVNYPRFYPDQDLVTVASGHSVTVNVTTVIHDAPNQIDLKVEGYEDDSDAGGFPGPVLISAVGQHGDLAIATATIGTAKSGTGESFGKAVTMTSHHVKGGNLRFTVAAYYTVSYA